jgi:hypothetical protein
MGHVTPLNQCTSMQSVYARIAMRHSTWSGEATGIAAAGAKHPTRPPTHAVLPMSRASSFVSIISPAAT